MLRGRDPHGGEVGCTGRPAWLGREVPCECSRKFIRAGMIAPNRSPSKDEVAMEESEVDRC